MHRWVENYVQSADLMDQAEEIFQVHILQVDRDRFAGVLGTAVRLGLGKLRLLLSGEVDSRLDRWCRSRILHSRMRVDGDQFCGGLVRESGGRVLSFYRWLDGGGLGGLIVFGRIAGFEESEVHRLIGRLC